MHDVCSILISREMCPEAQAALCPTQTASISGATLHTLPYTYTGDGTTYTSTTPYVHARPRVSRVSERTARRHAVWRTGDPGDSVEGMRPREGNAANPNPNPNPCYPNLP